MEKRANSNQNQGNLGSHEEVTVITSRLLKDYNNVASSDKRSNGDNHPNCVPVYKALRSLSSWGSESRTPEGVADGDCPECNGLVCEKTLFCDLRGNIIDLSGELSPIEEFVNPNSCRECISCGACEDIDPETFPVSDETDLIDMYSQKLAAGAARVCLHSLNDLPQTQSSLNLRSGSSGKRSPSTEHLTLQDQIAEKRAQEAQMRQESTGK